MLLFFQKSLDFLAIGIQYECTTSKNFAKELQLLKVILYFILHKLHTNKYLSLKEFNMMIHGYHLQTQQNISGLQPVLFYNVDIVNYRPDEWLFLTKVIEGEESLLQQSTFYLSLYYLCTLDNLRHLGAIF